MYRLNSEKIRLDLDGEVWVEPLLSWALQHELTVLWQAFANAKKPQDGYTALGLLADRFVLEAMPTWDFGDHRGRVPETARGFMRLPLDTQMEILKQWIANEPPKVAREPIDGLNIRESDAPTAADAVLPPQLAVVVNRELRKAKKAA